MCSVCTLLPLYDNIYYKSSACSIEFLPVLWTQSKPYLCPGSGFISALLAFASIGRIEVRWVLAFHFSFRQFLFLHLPHLAGIPSLRGIHIRLHHLHGPTRGSLSCFVIMTAMISCRTYHDARPRLCDACRLFNDRSRDT